MNDLNRYLQEQYNKNSKKKQSLNEGVFKDFFRGAKSRLSGFVEKFKVKLIQSLSTSVGQVKRVFAKKIGNSNYVVYEKRGPKGFLYGFLYPDAPGKLLNGSRDKEGLTLCKAYLKGKNPRRPETIVLAFDKKIKSGSINKSNTNIIKTSQDTQAKTYADLPESKSLFESMNIELNSDGRLDEIVRSPLLKRGKKDFLHRQSDAYEKERADSFVFKRASNSSDVVIPNEMDIQDDDDYQEYIATAKVKPGTESIADILSEFITALAYRTSKKQPIPSLVTLGFPGTGKTSIVKAFADKANFKIHVLEVASIYKEILGGFPTIEDGPDYQAKLTRLMQGPDAKDKIKAMMADPEREIAKWNMEEGDSRSQVVMKSADIFPPEDGKIHVFFLDEYNRDAEKMAASMNLLLNGAIGNQYELPLKTIVIAAGNLGMEIDKVDVVRMDNATFDRFDAAVMMQKDMISGAEFATGDYKDALDDLDFVDIDKQASYDINMGGKELGNGVTTCMDIFVGAMAKEHGIEFMDNSPIKLNLKPLTREYTDELDDYESDDSNDFYLLTPRKLQTINDRMKTRVKRDWILAKEHEKEDKGELLPGPEDISTRLTGDTKKFAGFNRPEHWEKEWEGKKENYKSRGLFSPAALYMHVMQWHMAYLPTVLKQVLGAYPGELISLIRQTAEEAIKESNQISVEDIIYGYFPKWQLYGHKMEVGKKVQTFKGDEFNERILAMSSITDNVMRTLVDVLISDHKRLATKIFEVNGKKNKFEDIVKDIAELGPKIPSVESLIAFNLHTFMKLVNPSTDRMMVLVSRMKDFGFNITAGKDGKAVVEDGGADNGIDVNEKAREIVGKIYGRLVKFNPTFQESRMIAAKATFDEIDGMNESNIIEEGLKTLFGKWGK